MKQLHGVVKPVKLRSLSRALGELMGSYRSAFRGNGLEFDDSRLYVPGDDPRMIMWRKSTPPHLYIKTCREERDLRITLFLDISGSMEGMKDQISPFEIMKQVATLLVASAVASRDRLALGCFAEQMVKYVPPRRGLRHALSLLDTIDNLTPVHANTNLGAALEGFLRARPKRSLLFIISDGIYTTAYEKILDRVSFRHDVIVINPVQGQLQGNLTAIKKTVIPVIDPETGKSIQIAISGALFDQLAKASLSLRDQFRSSVKKRRASYLEIRSEDNPLLVLTSFFERRGRLHAVH